MAKSTTGLKKPTETFKSATPAMAGRVFTISLKGVPRVDAKTKGASGGRSADSWQLSPQLSAGGR